MLVRAVFAAFAQRDPFRRDPFRDRSPAGAGRHGESALEVHLKASAHFPWHSAAPSRAKWQCRRGIGRPSPALSRAAIVLVFAAPLREKRARRWDPSSCETFHSCVRSLRRSPGKRSRPLRPAPVRVLPGAGIVRVDAAPRGPLSAGSESSLLDFFFSFFPGLSRRRSRFAVRGVSAALRLSYIILFVGADNLLHQVVPHHVLLAELHHADSVNLPAHFQRFNQAGLLPL